MTYIDSIIPGVQHSTHFKFTDLTGLEKGYLTVINFQGWDSTKQLQWLCHCSACGRYKLLQTGSINRPVKPSCGCLNNGGKVTHGKTDTSVYKRWKAMRRRCLNPATVDYKNYGGRGIKVCERWDKFENFYADMGDPPTGMTLERRDTNGEYCPENCYWASWTDQMNNRRNSIFLTLNGRTQTLPMWSREIHIKQSTLAHRHRKGWSDEKILTTPLRKWHSYRV